MSVGNFDNMYDVKSNQFWQQEGGWSVVLTSIKVALNSIDMKVVRSTCKISKLSEDSTFNILLQFVGSSRLIY